MLFTDSRQAERLVDAYFKYIKGEYHIEHLPPKGKPSDEPIRQKIWDREPDPPTITGLALHLGFDSLADFEQHKNGGEYAPVLKRGWLRIEAEYEKRLHQQSPTGAIFALKTLGWAERDTGNSNNILPVIFKIQIIDSGIATASDEREVIL